MKDALLQKTKTVAVIGLGYVGLPVALAMAKVFRVIGFDLDEARIAQLRLGFDHTGLHTAEAFADTDLYVTTSAAALSDAHFFVVTVPTPVDEAKTPDLSALLTASETIGKALKRGDVVVYESTVYPGCTEEECVPVLEKCSGLKAGLDFSIGYSPERINPGDNVHTVANIVKIVAGHDTPTTQLLAGVYGQIVQAGVYQAPNIRVAEAAKVVENTQRDLNISLMNELAILFDRLNIDTLEVLRAAATKWNFMPFTPGLVGGHCISVDPYYLLHKARQVGYEPQVIHAGRRVNDEMPGFIAKRLIQRLLQRGYNPAQCRVLVLGITFKENMADVRNAKTADLVHELAQYAVGVDVMDTRANPNDVWQAHGFRLQTQINTSYDAVILAVAHDEYRHLTAATVRSWLTDAAIVFDLKGIFDRHWATPDMEYWRL